jgi:microcystin degradation protein MlrC
MNPSIVVIVRASFRIGVAGFLHESNTFVSRRTVYDDFASTSLTWGQAMVDRWQDSPHELGGMLTGCAEEGFQAVPLYATFAVPGGPVEQGTFERIAGELEEQLRASMLLDGLLLALHGATVAEHQPDADGEIVRRIRGLVGPDLPLVITFDLHANLSPQMIELSNAAIGYRTNPHLDQHDRGREAASLIGRVVRGEVIPQQALVQLPLVIANSKQHTAALPASSLYQDLECVLLRPGILSASIAMGFAHADVAEMGASFLAVADRDPSAARAAAEWMSWRAWENRAQLRSELPGVEEAVRRAAASLVTPVVLMDVGDNAGGGAAANSTVLLEELQRQGVPNGLIVLFDPESVAACQAVGVRNPVSLRLGGRLEVNGIVRVLADGIFEETQVRHGGWKWNDQGITAVIETADRHTIVLTSRRMAPFSLEQLLSLGIHPERKRVLIVKGVIAPRAAYEPVASQFILVDTPGQTADNPARLPYKNRRRPLYPLDDDSAFLPPALGD